MTLREKFKTEVSINTEGEAGRFANKCEQIADNYAIEFAQWITNEKSKYSIMYGNQNKRFADFDKEYTSKELLEIFKKEKGL